MKKYMLTLIATLGLTAALTSTTAFAQMPNMDMSWAMRSQMQLQQQGDATARATAMAYYRYMLQLRRMGYTGPSLPTGVTPETLRGFRAAAAAVNGCLPRIVRGQFRPDQQRRQQLGLSSHWRMPLVVDVYGTQRWVCP